MLPARKKKIREIKPEKDRFPGHRKWIRGFHCVVSLSEAEPETPCDLVVTCAHVDHAGGKGMGKKVADWHTVPLCFGHHQEYHQKGARTCEKKYGLDLVALAEEFAKKSPYWRKMKEAM